MPRTKQTAGKSTGERAPRLQLPIYPSVVAFPVPGPEQRPRKLTKKSPDAAATDTRDLVQSNSFQVFFSLILVFSGAPDAPTEWISLIALFAGSALFVVFVSSSRSRPSLRHRSFSAPCAIWNGIRISPTTFVFLSFPVPNFAHPCQAFLDADHRPISSTPTVLGALESRGWFCRADSSAFAILSFRHESVDDTGHPPRLVDTFIKSYLPCRPDSPSRLHYYDLVFSLDTPKLINEFRRKVDLMIEELQRCVPASRNLCAEKLNLA